MAVTWTNRFGGKNPKTENDFFATFAVAAKTFFDVHRDMEFPPKQLAAWKADRQGAVLDDVLARPVGVTAGDKVTAAPPRD